MKMRSTQSRERVKGRSPLWSPEAKPLAGQGQRPWVSPINTRAKHENAINSIARKGQGTKSLVESRGKASGGSRAAPLGFPGQTRGQSMKMRPTQSRKGSRDEVPCGVQRKSLWRVKGSALGFPRTNTRAKHENATNSIAKRVKGGTPLRGQGAAPLGSLHFP